MFNGKKKRKKAIIIDELEGISSSNKKTIIKIILNLRKTRQKIPIFFISLDTYFKNIKELLKYCDIMKFKPNYINDCRKICKKYFKTKLINYIISISNNNLFILQN